MQRLYSLSSLSQIANRRCAFAAGGRHKTGHYTILLDVSFCGTVVSTTPVCALYSPSLGGGRGKAFYSPSFGGGRGEALLSAFTPLVTAVTRYSAPAGTTIVGS